MAAFLGRLDDHRDIVARLRIAGFHISIGDELRVLRLLDLLQEKGTQIDTPDALVNWLSPVLCTRSDQVKRLRDTIAPYFANPPTSPQSSYFDSLAPARWQRYLGIFVWLIVLGFVALVIYGLKPLFSFVLTELLRLLDFAKYFTPGVIPGGAGGTGEASSSAIPSGLIIIPILISLSAIVYRRRRMALRQAKVIGQGELVKVRLDPPRDDGNNPQLLRASRVLNRPTETPTHRLDVVSTIKATAAAAGRFVPVEEVRRIPANWLLLVESAGPEDPLPVFGSRLSKLFDRTRVRHVLYEFKRTPAWVRKDGRGQLMSIDRAIASDRPTRVLMLAEAGHLVDSDTAGPAKWWTNSDLPAPIVLLTPKSRETWGVAEAQAAQAGALVLPADAEGLSSLAKRLQADDLQPDRLAYGGDDEIEHLQAERFIWLSQVEPAPEDRKSLMSRLKRILDQKDFVLLVGIAAFPEVRLDLMSTLDAFLHPSESAAGQRARLLRIGRLVWLKESFFPGWLRSDLLQELPRDELDHLREVWLSILERPADEKSEGASLSVHMVKARADEDAQGDGLFLDFVRGTLDLPVSAGWARLAGRWKAPDRTEVLIALGGALAALLIPIIRGDLAYAFDVFLKAWAESVALLNRALPTNGLYGKALSFLVLAPLVIGFLSHILRHRRGPVANNTSLALAAVVFSAFVVLGGWMVLSPSTESPDVRDLLAPIIAAAATAFLFLLQAKTTSSSDKSAWTLLQLGRGTGLSDTATLLALLWLFLSGVLLLAVDRPEAGTWTTLVAQILIVSSLLGVTRASVISASGMQIQPPPEAPIGLQARLAFGLASGLVVGAAAYWIVAPAILLFNPISSYSARVPVPLELVGLLNWHLVCCFETVGAATGLTIAMKRAGFVPPFRTWGYCLLGAVLVHACQYLLIFALPVYGSIAALLPFSTVAAITIAASSHGPASQRRAPVFFALVLIVAVSTTIVWLTLLFVVPWLYRGPLLALPIALTAVTAWPLLQRVFTEEPSVDREPEGFRARPVAPALWIAAPIVLLVILRFRLSAKVVLSLADLVIPAAIYLGWRFGLRGWRTALLMVVPAALIRGSGLISPPTVDVAAAALVMSALFARPGLLKQICSVSELPRGAVLAIAAIVSLALFSPSFPIIDVAGSPASPQDRVDQSAGKNPTRPLEPHPGIQPNSQQFNEAQRKSPADPLVSESQKNAPTSFGGNTIFESGRDAASWPALGFTWQPSVFLVLTLGLVGLSQLRGQGYWIVFAVGAASVASLALDSIIGVDLPIWPVSPLTAISGIIAYALGRYFRALITKQRLTGSQWGYARRWIPVFLLMQISAVASAASLVIPDAPFVNDISLLALAIFAAWTASIVPERSVLFSIIGAIVLALTGSMEFLAGIRVAALRHDLDIGFNDGFGAISSVIPPLLPAFFFVLGRVCREVAFEAVQTVRAELKRGAVPSSGPKKRIVLLMDGTGATEESGRSISNVRKLYLYLARDVGSLPQVVFYSAGATSPFALLSFTTAVTSVFRGMLGSIADNVVNASALAPGYFRDEQVLAGYKFLVGNFSEGDEIYLFGFGRGAYAARAVAGLVHTIGLLSPEHIDFASAGLTLYKKLSGAKFSDVSSSAELREDSALHFEPIRSARSVAIRFVGVWDTITPVPRSDWPFTRANPSVQSFRQAMAIDERRRMFRLYRWTEPQPYRPWPDDVKEQDIKQVWFAGSHADVGGGYPEEESGLSKYPLLWIIEEAVNCGFIMDQDVVERLAWELRSNKPDIRSRFHNPLTPLWRIIELVPKASRWKEWPARQSFLGFYIPNGEPRFIPENALIHASVIDRIEADPNYHPVNLPSRYSVVLDTGTAREGSPPSGTLRMRN
jgi:uncharacterized protein (DUF2235 family)